MAMNRITLWLLGVGLYGLFASGAAAQVEEQYLPHVDDVQIFGPADLSEYGNGPKRPEGWFGSLDYLNWSISAPEVTTIGMEGFNPTVFDGSHFITQPNSMTTGFIESSFRSGNRVEFGVVDDGRGWLVSAFALHDNGQRAVGTGDGGPVGGGGGVGVSFAQTFSGGVGILEGFRDFNLDGFDDDFNGNNVYGRSGLDLGTAPTPFPPPLDGIPDVGFPTDFGDLVTFPVFFDKLDVRTKEEVLGVELMRLWQLREGKRGGLWEFYAGVRFFQFRDQFDVDAMGLPDPTTPDIFYGTLANSYWYTNAENNLVGPQLGVRYSRSRGRLHINAEGRFMAAANYQSIRQSGLIASEAVPGQGYDGVITPELN